MFEKYVYLTLIKGGQEKESTRNKFLLLGALNGQISKICIVKVCFCRHIGAMWLSCKNGTLSLILIGYFFEHVINFG